MAMRRRSPSAHRAANPRPGRSGRIRGFNHARRSHPTRRPSPGRSNRQQSGPTALSVDDTVLTSRQSGYATPEMKYGQPLGQAQAGRACSGHDADGGPVAAGPRLEEQARQVVARDRALADLDFTTADLDRAVTQRAPARPRYFRMTVDDHTTVAKLIRPTRARETRCR